MNDHTKKALLVILDGWGIGLDPERSAIAQADTPFYDDLIAHHPNSTLITFGKNVGLPEGQMGNSEVGHLNIGAGRVVYQELARINNSIEQGQLRHEKGVQHIVESVKASNGRIHLMGLFSDGGVHAHTAHFRALIRILEDATDSDIFLHTFTDGRDTGPQTGVGYLEDLSTFLEDQRTQHASVIGRYYAMDRDQRWERIQKAYDLLVHRKGAQVEDLVAAVRQQYEEGITDEFMPALASKSVLDAEIKSNDHVVFVNFRTDRPRQLVQVLIEKSVPEYGLNVLPIELTSMTRYDDEFVKTQVIFDRSNVTNTIGQYLSDLGKTQLRAAETEKYAHVTYFLNGGEEAVYPGEERILIPSPKVATYDLQPEMSAVELTNAVMTHLREHQPDFICINYANTDMVGHTGVFDAAVTAAQCVDQQAEKLVGLARSMDYQVVIIADHGNSDYMINDDGSPHTAHTTNLVPFIVLGDDISGVNSGKLADVAPTILTLMGITPHPEMTGDVLVEKTTYLPSSDSLKPYQPISCSHHDILLDRATRKKVVLIKYISEGGESIMINDVIVDVYTQNKAEYLKTQNGKIIRLDHIKEVDGVLISHVC